MSDLYSECNVGCFWQVEDILALGICVEQTKLLSVTSLQECKIFVSRVEYLQPCVDRAFGHKYMALCSRGCVQHLDSIRCVCRMYCEKKNVSVLLGSLITSFVLFRSLWNGMRVVASFIQQVVFKVRQSDLRLEKVALKHCNLHLSVSKMVLGCYAN